MDDYTLKVPFVKYISAPRGSGKTYLIINLLTNENFYLGKFDKVYFICPSFHSDPKYSVLDIPDNQIMTEFDAKKIEKIVKSKKEDEQILLVFDDCITQDGFKKNQNNNVLNTIAVNGRHMGVSMIIASQKTSGASSFIRSQADGVVVFKSRSLAEIDSIYQDNSIGSMSKRDFINLLDFATIDKYSFLYINYQTNKIYKKFDEIVIE